ncbi:E3 ubiquitin-protein ligase ATL23 [Abeliophyllum distichum]|uniref:E3 ubiquitin-protein ligase ATL23 n=1 Tax=Abeliophyllum distichum TaxID=126358 RepID=A0ABD1TK61_9LAMI
MLVSVFIALFLPCAGMTAVFLVYSCLLWYAADSDNDQEFQSPVKPSREEGLSASDLEKLPKVTGKDLVLGTDCAVCLDDIESDQPVRMVPGCNHGFHLQCADTWLSKQSVCPVCRAKLGPELFNPPESNPC